MRFTRGAWTPVVDALAVLLAARALAPIIAGTEYLYGTFLVVAASAAVGAIAALLRLPAPLTLLAQVVAMAAVLWWRAAFLHPLLPGSPQDTNPVVQVIELARAGAESVRMGTLPLAPDPGLTWLIPAVMALIALVVELLVVGLEQPAWSLAPLALPYLISALTVPKDLDWPLAAAVLAGYVAILLAGTTMAERASPSRAGFHLARIVTASGMAAAALVVALVVAGLTPMGQKLPWLDAGSNAPIELADPTIALNENLVRPAPQPVLYYETSDGRPTYLRTVALTRLSTSGAQLVPMRLEAFGLSSAYDAPGEQVETRVEMDFGSEYLPVPFAAKEFRADGSWAFDPVTLAVVATGAGRLEQTRGLTYSVTSTVPRPSQDEIRAAVAGRDPGGDETLEVPAGLDPGVAVLLASITSAKNSAGEKALAIQEFLRSDAFTYTLQAPRTAGMDVISTFLLRDRAGYCIHFAAAMVAMARMEGIPARMAVGFTPGVPQGEGFAVTTHDMHTWPELYLDGLGWVPFEPTPSVAGAPGSSAPEGTPTPEPTPSADVPSASPTPTAAEPSPTDRPSTAPDPAADPGAGAAGALPAILLVVVLVLLLPAAVRAGLTYWRLRPGREPAATATSAWREVRATFADVGLVWDEGTPTLALSALLPQVPESAHGLLGDIAATVERVHFSRDGADVGLLGGQVRAVRRQLLQSQSWPGRLRALLLPASLVPGRAPGRPPGGPGSS